MIEDRIVQILGEIVGSTNISREKADKITHSYDATQQSYLPDVVVYVKNTEQVAKIITLANKEKIPIVPRGAGSGFTGGTLPIMGGIVLVLTRMNRIIDIDTDNLTAIVEPGVVTGQFQKAVEKLGLFYPPDPASLAFSTLGGNVAECAGGPRCVKYGVTKDYVLGLTMVTPTGDIIHTGGRTMKNVVGYDLTKLFVGSEGTLGIATEITLKLIPKPEAKKTMLVYFETIDGAAQAVSNIIKNKIIPTTLEFLDAATIDCVRKGSGLDIPQSCHAILIIEVDGDADILDKQTQKILTIVQPSGVIDTRIAHTHEESEAIWAIRRNVSPSLRKINPDKFNEDIVVPRSKVPDMIRAIEKISREFDVPIINFGHAGDGNIHVNIMVDLKQDGMKETAHKALDKLFTAVIEMNGSISGEHGIGTAKSPYLNMEVDECTVSYMQTIKRIFDPNNIMNPGKIFSRDS